MAESYDDWLARGRQHLWQGRLVDAILCFRRATRLEPRRADAPFHAGEALWQLGLAAEAIAVWRDASAADARHLAPRLALAEASLTQRDFRAARVAADEAVALDPAIGRARLVAALARLALEEGDADADFATAAGEIGTAPDLLGVPALAGALADALDARRTAPARRDLQRALAQHASALPPALAARAAEGLLEDGADAAAHSAARAAIDAALERHAAPADFDALRRLAVVARRGGAADAAVEFARRHALACLAHAPAPVPLLWPERTAGDGLRAIVVLDPAACASDVAVLGAALRSARQPETLVLAPGDVAALRSKCGALLPTSTQWAPLPPDPDAGFARALALRDADVLIDAIGLAAPLGPLLALRPARSLWALAEATFPHAAPLVDRLLAAGELGAALAQVETAPGPHCTARAAELAARFESAVRAHQGGDSAAAQAGYDALLAQQPASATVLHLSGTLARDAGDSAAARARFAAAVAAAPRYDDARLAAIRLELDTGEVDRAHSEALAATERAPASVPLWRALGQVELRRRDGARAAAAFERALALEPADGETHYNHGVALQMQGAFADAARAYQRALAFRPDLVAADFNLGVIFQQQGNAAAAAAAYRGVIARVPAHVPALRNLGETLLGAGRVDAFVDHFRRFERAAPEALPLAVQALEACQYAGDFAGVERYLDGLRRERFRSADEAELVDSLEQLLYLLLFFDVEPAMLHHFAGTYDAAARKVYGEPLQPPAQRRPGRLRIGYLSADLRNHVMGKMVWQAIERHDRSRFDLHFYSMSSVRDEWTARFESVAAQFESIAALSDEAAVERIAAADLDLLVDLQTHTRGARPGILARKPARVQLTHVASAGTLGLRAVDFKLTDAHADVPESQAFQLERLLAMDGCVYPFRHVEPAQGPVRAALGIAEDAFVIGAFVNPLKLSRRCLALWRDVLLAVPQARIALSPANPAFRGAYERLARAAGIERGRLVYVPQGRDDAGNQARYRIVDAVLDPLPFGGVNGTIEALDMGVPVVTLVGRRHGERTSYSMLTALGVADTVAATGRDYVEIAVRLARDAAFARRVREAIRAGLAHSVLTDAQAHARNLEAAYRAAVNMVAPDALAAADEAR